MDEGLRYTYISGVVLIQGLLGNDGDFFGCLPWEGYVPYWHLVGRGQGCC